MQGQFRLVPVVVLLVVGVGLVGEQLRAFGTPEVERVETVGHISLSDGAGGVGLFTVQNTSAGWSITGVRVGDDGVAQNIEIRQGGELFIPTSRETLSASVELEAVQGAVGTVYQGTLAAGENVVVVVSPDATGPGSPGDPQAIGFWRGILGTLGRMIRDLANAGAKQATGICGSAANVCSASTSAGPAGVSFSVTCCGPHTPEAPQAPQ